MLSLADMSSPSCMPVFDVHPNHQDQLDRFQGWSYDKVNACATSQFAAGSLRSPPFPSTSPPSLNAYSFDQWTPLINSDISSDIQSNDCIGFPVADPSFSYGSQDSLSSSPYSSTPPSSMASPLDDSLLYLTSPDLLSLDPSSPFKASEVGSQDLVVPALPHQCHTIAWPLPTDISHSIPPAHHLHPYTDLSGELVTVGAPNIENQSPQGTVANNLSAVPEDFISSPIFAETTALGLYYSDTTQSPDVPLLSAQDEDNVSVPCVVQPVAPPAQNWTFRAVDPAAKASRSKHVQSDKARTPDHVLATASPTNKVEPVVECRKCGYLQSTKRMGDFRRHLKKHDADYLSRVVCCGVPPTHPAATSLRSGHLTHWYDGHLFYGGCGRSYSRMDALQRHLKKSGCIGGSAKDHQTWRRLYFRDKTGRPLKSAMSSVSSVSQKSSVLSPEYSLPRASSSLL